MHLAADRGYFPIVKLLVIKGANLGVKVRPSIRSLDTWLFTEWTPGPRWSNSNLVGARRAPRRNRHLFRELSGRKRDHRPRSLNETQPGIDCCTRTPRQQCMRMIFNRRWLPSETTRSSTPSTVVESSAHASTIAPSLPSWTSSQALRLSTVVRHDEMLVHELVQDLLGLRERGEVGGQQYIRLFLPRLCQRGKAKWGWERTVSNSSRKYLFSLAGKDATRAARDRSTSWSLAAVPTYGQVKLTLR